MGGCKPLPPDPSNDDELSMFLHHDNLPLILHETNISMHDSDLSCSESENSISVLPQYDGNVSISSSCTESSLHCSAQPKPQVKGNHKIPVIVGFRPTKSVFDRGMPYWKRIRYDKKVVNGLSLPRITIYNMHLLIYKINNIFFNRGMGEFRKSKTPI